MTFQSFSTQRRTALAAALLLPWAVRASPAAEPALDVPYVPTPMAMVEKMLEMAELRQGDMLYDLGCGDGRIVIAAVRRYGVRGVGIDLDPRRIDEANANAQRAGVSDRTRFLVGDLFEADFSDADVVTLYLLPGINERLRPQLWRQLKVGARVVSHEFGMGTQWPPERSERVGNATAHRWTIDERVKAMGLGSRG
jgi:SAM-dependent methyltransferase